MILDILDQCKINRGTLNHLYSFHHWVRLYLLTVMCTNIYVDSQHFSFSNQLHKRSVINKRSAMSNAGFDDEVGLHLPDNLLHSDHVLRILDDRSTHPCKVV